MKFETRADWYNGPCTEDGERELWVAIYVVAEAADGRRWAHDGRFNAYQGGRDEDAAAAKCEALADRIGAAFAAGRKLDADNWNEIDPCYGSAAYVSQGTEAEAVFRESEAERFGY